jgi:GAF domain-containing protein
MSSERIALAVATTVRSEITNTLDFHATLDLIVGRMILATGAGGAALALKQGDEMPCGTSIGCPAPQIGTCIIGGASGKCARMGLLIRSDDTQADPRVNIAVCKELGIRSMILLPLVRNPDSVIGVLGVFSSQANAFDSDDVEIVSELGRLLVTVAKEQ